MLSDLQELWKSTSGGILLKQRDVEAINVPLYCDELSSAIQRSPVTVNRSSRDSKGAMSFHMISSLSYLTLRTHEMQVDYLLEETKSLVAKTKFGLVDFKPQKRRISNIGTKRKYKRQRVLNSIKDTSNTNYTHLMAEAEDIVEFGQTDITELFEQTNGAGVTANATHIQIREVIITAEFENAGTDLAEDEDFVEAPANDFNELLELFADKRGLPPAESRPSIKNKFTTEDDFVAKKQRLNEKHSITQINCKLSQTDENANNLNEDLEREIEEILSEKDYHVEIDTVLSTLDKEISSPQDNNVMQHIAKFSSRKKLIIDASTVLLDTERLMEIQNTINVNERLLQNRAKVQMQRKYKSSIDLLSTHNRSINITYEKKLKRKLPASKEFCDILRDCLGHNFNEQIADEVFPKWNMDCEQSAKKRKVMDGNALPATNDFLLVEANENDYNNNNNKDLIRIEHPTTTEDKWCPYDLMMRILNIFRHLKIDSILVAYMLPSDNLTRNEAARAFSSLLALAAGSYIKILPCKDSIEASKICLGAKSEDMILSTHHGRDQGH